MLQDASASPLPTNLPIVMVYSSRSLIWMVTPLVFLMLLQPLVVGQGRSAVLFLEAVIAAVIAFGLWNLRSYSNKLKTKGERRSATVVGRHRVQGMGRHPSWICLVLDYQRPEGVLQVGIQADRKELKALQPGELIEFWTTAVQTFGFAKIFPEMFTLESAEEHRRNADRTTYLTLALLATVLILTQSPLYQVFVDKWRVFLALHGG